MASIRTRTAKSTCPRAAARRPGSTRTDVGEAAARGLCTDSFVGSVIALTGPALPSTAEALSVLGSLLGHRHDHVDVPEQAAREAMENTGMPVWLVNALLEPDALIRQGHAATLANGVQQVLGRAACAPTCTVRVPCQNGAVQRPPFSQKGGVMRITPLFPARVFAGASLSSGTAPAQTQAAHTARPEHRRANTVLPTQLWRARPRHE